MLRRDRHKVYAADLHQHEGEDRDSVFSPTVFSQDGLSGRGSHHAPHVTRKGDCSDQDAHALREGGYDGARPYDQFNDNGGEATNIGSIGPGAEPPVAVAFRAFAHEEPRTDAICDRSESATEQDTEMIPLSVSCSDRDGMRSLSAVEGDVTCGDEEGLFGGKQDITNSRPASTRTSNEGEADTLPDSFHLSDEFGPEGASTGRNQHDDDEEDDGSMNGRCEPFFIGIPTDTSYSRRSEQSGGTKPSSGRHSRESENDDESPSGLRRRQEDKGGAMYGSVSDNSDGWSSSSGRLHYQPRQLSQPQLSRRRARRGSRRAPLSVIKRNSRIAPSEDLASPTNFEVKGGRRHRRSSCKHRSPPRRYPRGNEDSSYHRRGPRGVSGHRNREVRREALTETESMCGGPNDELEEEVTKLRRENEELKRQQERKTRSRCEGFKVETRKNSYNVDECFAMRDSPRRETRRREDDFDLAGQPQRLASEKYAPIAQQKLQHEQRRRSHSIARTSHLSDMDASAGRSISRRRRGASTWSDFVSKSNSSPGPIGPMGPIGPESWGLGSSKIVSPSFDLSLPRVLVEGGFLWKIPCHNAGTPKRRWFQIKPAEGLLTTASGRLVVRPNSTGDIGAGSAMVGGRKVGSAVSRRSEDGGGRNDSAQALPVLRVRAAWPLALIWVDPERDLRRSPPREMSIEEVMDLARGHKTPAFWQQAAHRGIHTLPDPKLCFSLIGRERTLDLAAESLLETKEWVLALARVALMVDRGGLAAANGFPALHSPRPQLESASTPTCPEFEKKSLDAKFEDNNDDGEKISRARVQRRLSEEAGKTLCEERDLCTRPAAKFIQGKAGVLGEGGAWSVDTVHAWRRQLFPAVTRGDVAGVLALFDEGCPVDLVHAETGDTPMLLACRLGDIGIVTECLRRGSRNDPHPDFGQTALQAAVAAGREACTRLLLETAAPSRSDVVVSNHKDPNKDTPLHVACRRGYSGIVEALLHHGADLRVVDRKGNTPLHGAAGCGHAAVLASLLDAGGDSVLEEKNARGERAMHTAAASGHIACVELLLGTAAEPDIPRADGQTPFALASRGGHLAVTRLIRRYAPDAGTPSGGDALFQTHHRASEGRRSATTDALPRPHMNAPGSNPGPTEHRNGDLEHRCYSAAGLEHRSETAPSSTGDGSMGCARPTSASTSSAPLSHGSLFDGLQVYVAGGRQPLGSQHATAAARAGMMSTSSAYTPMSARTMVLESHRLSASSQQQRQREHQGEQQRCIYAPPQQASQMLSSSASPFPAGQTLEPNWRDNVLSAPSTIAPSPPTPMFEDTGSLAAKPTTTVAATTLDPDANVVRAPGSARALARMIHFSNENHAASLTAGNIGPEKVDMSASDTMTLSAAFVGDVAGAAGSSISASSTGDAAEGGTHVKPLGSWMTPATHDHEKRKSNPNSTIRTPDVGDDGIEGALEKVAASSTVAGNATMPGGFGRDTVTVGVASEFPGTERDGKTSQDEEGQAKDCFVVESSREREVGRAGTGASAGLSGLWRVFHSEGYPYFLHDASGHSQWEDPRESKDVILSRERLLSVGASVTAEPEKDFNLERHSEEPDTLDGKMLPEQAKSSPEGSTLQEERDGQKRLPAPEAFIKPITPRKVPVSVNVSHFFYVDGAQTSATIAARDLGGCRGGRPGTGTASTPATQFGDRAEECNRTRVEAKCHREAGSSLVHADETCAETCGGSRDAIDNLNVLGSSDSVSFEDDACRRGNSGAPSIHAAARKLPTEVGYRRDNKSNSNVNHSDGGSNRESCKQNLVDNVVMENSHDPTTGKETRGEDADTGEEPRTQQRQGVQEHDDSSWSKLLEDAAERTVDDVRTVGMESPRVRPDLCPTVLDDIGKSNGKITGGQEGEGGHEKGEEWWQELGDETVGEANGEEELSSFRIEGMSA